MIRNSQRQNHQNSKTKTAYWISLILFLSLAAATGVIAQEGDAPDDGELTFEGNIDPIGRTNAQKTVVEALLPPRKDAFIASNDPNRNFGFDALMRFGYSDSGLGVTRPLFKFKVEDYIPSGAKIEKAELRVYMTAIRDSDSSRAYAVHSLTTAWDEVFVTWNNSPEYGPEIGRGTLGTVPGWQVTDITNEVKDWLKNPNNNKGIIFIGDGPPGQSHERDYFTKEATSTGLTPYLYVKFNVQKYDVASYVPVVASKPNEPYTNVFEQEPNNSWKQANGALIDGREYKGHFPNKADEQDYYFFYQGQEGPVSVELTKIEGGHNYDLVLRDSNLDQVGYSGELENSDEKINTRLRPGLYYVQVYNRSQTGSDQSYSLLVNYMSPPTRASN